MMSDCYDLEGRRQYMEIHLSELRADAERARLVRQLRTPRTLRRSVGRLLIAAGNALSGQSVEPCIELVTVSRPSRLAVRDRGPAA